MHHAAATTDGFSGRRRPVRGSEGRLFVKKSLIATLAAGGSLAVAGLVGGAVVDAAPAYPLPPTTTIAEQQPPPPQPPPVTLPRTGSDGVQSTVMMGGTLAAAGLGLVLVTRRRRQQPSAN